MKVIVATPGSTPGTPEVHADGCADVARGVRSGKYAGAQPVDVDALEDAALWFWRDFIREGSMTEAHAKHPLNIRYMPCAHKAVAS